MRRGLTPRPRVTSDRGYRLEGYENVLGYDLRAVPEPARPPGIEVRRSGRFRRPGQPFAGHWQEFPARWPEPDLDGALSAADEQRVLAHLDLCDGCSAYPDQIRTTITAVGRLPAEAAPVPPDRERLLQALGGTR